MNSSRRYAVSTLKILLPLCCSGVGIAYGLGLPDAAVIPAIPAASSKSPPALDLRVPELRRVLPHSELLTDVGSTDDENSIEVVAVPPLVPLSFEFEAPLGIVDSIQWSINHPTQAWRVVLPATVEP
jgi:hypothetical protein